jgi:hypothetical protein
MVMKWFPAAIAAVFIGPALAAAQAPGGPGTSPDMQTPQVVGREAAAPTNEATVTVSNDPVPNDPAPDPPPPPPPVERTGRELTLMGMVIVPDRSDRPVIQSVEPGSPAARAGFREDDLIEGIGRQATPTVHELLNFAIPLIRDLDPGTKLTWHVARDGRDIAVSIPRPTDRDLGPLSEIEQRVLERQAGSLGYYSSEVLPPPPPRPYSGRHHVGHDRYADAQYNWWYDGDEMPSFVSQWLLKTFGPNFANASDYQYYWWYDGD